MTRENSTLQGRNESRLLLLNLLPAKLVALLTDQAGTSSPKQTVISVTALGIDSIGIQSIVALVTQLRVTTGRRPLNREKPFALAEGVFTSKDQSRLLEEMIDKFGLIDKPIVNIDFTIIGGHQRIKILKKMKAKWIECWVPDRVLTEEEVNRLCIGLNRNQGEFDYEILGNAFEVIDLLSWGFKESDLFEEIAGMEKDLKGEGEKKGKKKKECPACGHEF